MDFKSIYVTMVAEDYFWKLLVLHHDSIYYSEKFTYKKLMYFKTPSKIEFIDNDLMIYSKNGKNELKLSKHRPSF